VQQQRTHDEDTATSHCASHGNTSFHNVMNQPLIKFTASMRTRDNTQCAVLLGTIVKV
jgi:hypothetical protein